MVGTPYWIRLEIVSMILIQHRVKLTQLDVTIQCQQDVVGFDISMNDTLGTFNIMSEGQIAAVCREVST
jgi:hypothetical protein